MAVTKAEASTAVGMQKAEDEVVKKAQEEGVTPSDAEKEQAVEAGGYKGESRPPGPSGSIMENDIRDDQPMDHPAVDSNPRFGVPKIAVKQDFNDPTA